jgi:hypothetical protein
MVSNYLKLLEIAGIQVRERFPATFCPFLDRVLKRNVRRDYGIAGSGQS